MFSSCVCFVFVPGLCPYFHHVYFVLRSKPVSMFSSCLLCVQFQAFVHVFITFALCPVPSLCPCFHHVCFVFQACVHVFIMFALCSKPLSMFSSCLLCVQFQAFVNVFITFALCSVPSLCPCSHHVCFVFSSKPLSMFSQCVCLCCFRPLSMCPQHMPIVISHTLKKLSTSQQWSHRK